MNPALDVTEPFRARHWNDTRASYALGMNFRVRVPEGIERLPTETALELHKGLEYTAYVAGLIPMSDHRWERLRDEATGALQMELTDYRVLYEIDQERLEIRILAVARVLRPRARQSKLARWPGDLAVWPE